MARAKGWTKGMYELSVLYWKEVIRSKMIEHSPTGKIEYWFDEELKKEIIGYGKWI
jgi:hypothetical protein